MFENVRKIKRVMVRNFFKKNNLNPFIGGVQKTTSDDSYQELQNQIRLTQIKVDYLERARSDREDMFL